MNKLIKFCIFYFIIFNFVLWNVRSKDYEVVEETIIKENLTKTQAKTLISNNHEFFENHYSTSKYDEYQTYTKIYHKTWIPFVYNGYKLKESSTYIKKQQN